MQTNLPSVPDATTRAPDDARSLLTSWRRSLAARRVSPATVATYSSAVERLADFLEAAGMPTKVGAIRREHVEAFIADVLTRRAPATAHNRYRGSQAYFAWALEEGEIREGPMAHMRPPRLPEAPPPILRDRSSVPCSTPVPVTAAMRDGATRRSSGCGRSGRSSPPKAFVDGPRRTAGPA